jgi:hypothetical protein
MRSIGNRRQDITRLSHQVTPVLNDPQIDCILLKRRPPCVLLGPPCCLVCLLLLRYCRLLGAVVAIRTEPPTTTAWEHFLPFSSSCHITSQSVTSQPPCGTMPVRPTPDSTLPIVDFLA